MGYRSDLVFGVSKHLITESLVTGKWPKLLQPEPEKTSLTHLFYEITGYKWYDGYTEVDEMNAFIAEHSDKEFDDLPAVAGIRIGEETDDIEEFGSPWLLGIWVNRTITY